MENRLMTRTEIESRIDEVQSRLVKIYKLGMQVPEAVNRKELNELEKRLSNLQNALELSFERHFIYEVNTYSYAK
jgi:predicted nuclease with TOPRIM domain